MSIQTHGNQGALDDRGFETWTVRHAPVELEDVRTVGAATFQGLSQKPGGRRWNQYQAGKYEVFIEYEGLSGDSPADGILNERAGWIGSTTEEPIESHPEIDKLVKNYGGYEDGEGALKWPRYLPDELAGEENETNASGFGTPFGGVSGFTPGAALPDSFGLQGGEGGGESEQEQNYMYGAEVYLARHRVLRHTFASLSYPAEVANLDGKIVSDLPGIAPGGPREGRNYMVLIPLIEYRGSGDAGAFDCEVHYVESEEGGWKPQYTILSL